MNISKIRAALMAVLKKDHPNFDVSRLPDSPKAQRDILDDLLIASNTKWSDDILALFDQVHSRRRPVVPWTSIPNRQLFHGTAQVAIWKGDITTLQIDAIVNAANDAGLGCFVPQHRCIDNVIHRAAGPRLREACRTAMEQRGYPLHAGTPPIVTPGYNLPSNYVVHVTGPQIEQGTRLTESDRELLASAYQGCLQQCADNGIRKIAFCCISTGLFGFPQDEASNIAITSVLEWLEEHPEQIDLVVFNVFSDKDENLYQKRLAYLGTPQQQTQQNQIGEDGVGSRPSSPPSARDRSLRLAKTWIEKADAILICAGSGMSVKEGEMVYVNPTDFAKHYPWFVKWGYRTSYEVMGLGQDRRVPMTAKWAMWAKHMHLQRWQFEPNEGYKTLLTMVNEKDYFVLTSNVDGCFERSGFAKERIYTPQGEWTYYQCKRACRKDAVFESRPMLDSVVPHISSDGFIAEHLIPKCKYCGGEVFGNVRSDGNFLHGKYEAHNDALRRWMKMHRDSNSTVVIIEVGAGYNTPTVTRFPVESFTRQLGTRGHLIRINPTDPEVPSDLTNALAIAEGWQVLNAIQVSSPSDTEEADKQEVMNLQTIGGRTLDYEQSLRFAPRFGHFDWNTFLGQLKDY